MTLPVVEECLRNLASLVFICPHHELFNESLKSIYYKNIPHAQFVRIFAAVYKYVVFSLTM